MGKKIKLILSISLVINFIFILLGGYIIHKKGGIEWIKEKTKFALNNKVNENNYSPYYLTKKSIFETQKNNSNAIVFLGDSITDNYDWYEEFQNINIQNRGISQDTTDGVLNRLDDIVAEKPKKIFLMLGINDLGQSKTVNYIINNYDNIINKIKTESPDTIIYIQSVLPINKSLNGSGVINIEDIIKLNTNLQQLSNCQNIIYIDIYDSVKDDDNNLNKSLTYDGTHLNGEGYKIWIYLIKNYI
jgi:lysophospholipase L1-like esterase